MEAFRKKEIRILVATTVVEVGMDVPDAAVMVIENADRFGLAQLHQLRGRVGRGSQQAYCFLLSQTASQASMERLQIFTHTSDGFEIARKDLELRGPGEFFGTRQHGADSMVMRRIAANTALLADVRKAAKNVLDHESDREYAAIFAGARDAWQRDISRIALN